MKNNPLSLLLSDILFLLGVQTRTGELVVESGNNIGTMILHRGKILQAFSPYSRAIGDLLVEDGLISDAELIETLKVQKRNAYSPIGGLLLKKGRVTFEVVETMVHEQIRQAIKEFQSWSQINFNFIDKEITPYDRIHLPVHEFLSREFLDSARQFIDFTPDPADTPAARVTSTTNR